MTIKIIQHRANDHRQKALAEYAEIDVWLDSDGKFRVKHDVTGDRGWVPPILLRDYLAAAPFKGYFVNIKQAIARHQLADLTNNYFKRGQLIGLFDVPQPLAYYADYDRETVYHRRSEFERFDQGVFHWVDPLEGQTPWNFAQILNTSLNHLSHHFMICCPSLHGLSENNSRLVWDWTKERMKKQPGIIGLVTKYPTEAREFFGD
jgi:hypothetical protein